MSAAHLAVLALGAAAPTLALAQETQGFSHGWLWAIATLLVVGALFLLLFKRRPPLEGHGPGPAHRP
jgi:hypothetical protein